LGGDAVVVPQVMVSLPAALPRSVHLKTPDARALDVKMMQKYRVQGEMQKAT
jgi:hypothetical protein